MSKIAYKVAFSMIVIMALLGMTVIHITVHELVHYFDVKNHGGFVTDICVLNLPFDKKSQTLGYVMWAADSVELTSFKSPELWPTLIGGSVFGILLFSLAYVFKYHKENYVEVNK